MIAPAVRHDIKRGRNAYEGGKTEQDCPYKEGTELGRRCAWLAGYRDAKRESGK